jgi:hypothetical protein
MRQLRRIPSTPFLRQSLNPLRQQETPCKLGNPATSDGKPIAEWYLFSIPFKLQN